MNAPSLYTPNSNIWAASIVGVSLLASAVIVSRSAAPTATEPLVLSAKPLVAPPLAQDAVRQQFREQVLASPKVNTYRVKGKMFTLSDVKVDRVVYEAKDDTFNVGFDWVWKEGNPGANWGNTAYLRNDGYGHYYGLVVLSPVLNGTGQSMEVTIK